MYNPIRYSSALPNFVLGSLYFLYSSISSGVKYSLFNASMLDSVMRVSSISSKAMATSETGGSFAIVIPTDCVLFGFKNVTRSDTFFLISVSIGLVVDFIPNKLTISSIFTSGSFNNFHIVLFKDSSNKTRFHPKFFTLAGNLISFFVGFTTLGGGAITPGTDGTPGT